jgi:hypothetical protein
VRVRREHEVAEGKIIGPGFLGVASVAHHLSRGAPKNPADAFAWLGKERYETAYKQSDR